MYAIFKTGGKQLKGEVGDKLFVEKTPWMGKEKKLTIKIPALSGVFLVRNSKKIRLD